MELAYQPPATNLASAVFWRGAPVKPILRGAVPSVCLRDNTVDSKKLGVPVQSSLGDIDGVNKDHIRTIYACFSTFFGLGSEDERVPTFGFYCKSTLQGLVWKRLSNFMGPDPSEIP